MSEEHLVGGHLVADADVALGDGAGDRRPDLGVAELALGVLERQLELLELVGGVVVGLLADQLLAVEVGLALVLAPRPGQLALDPLERGAQLVALQPQQNLAAADLGALLDQQLAHLELARGPRDDLDVVLGLEIGREAQDGLDRAAAEGHDLDRHRLLLVFLVALLVALLVLVGALFRRRIGAVLAVAGGITRPAAGQREGQQKRAQ